MAGKGEPARIFIVGYMHSGTTLLQNILMKHGDVYSGAGETSFFEPTSPQWREYADLADGERVREYVRFCFNLAARGARELLFLRSEELDPRIVPEEVVEAVARRAEEHRSLAATFVEVMDRLALLHGQGAWVEKTPAHIYHLDRILEAVPSARIVNLVRDPRDILASKKLRTRRARAEQEQDGARRAEALMRHYDPVLDALSWKSAVRAGMEREGDGSGGGGALLTVRYEDLVLDPEATLRTICRFAGIEFRSAMLDVDRYNVAGSDPLAVQSRGGFSARSIGRWRETLSPAEAAAAELLLHGELDRYGYERGRRTAGRVLRAAPRFPLAVGGFLDRMAKKARHRGPAYLLDTLKGYAARLLRLR